MDLLWRRALVICTRGILEGIEGAAAIVDSIEAAVVFLACGI